MQVSICVNNYMQFQGINSVTDQFLLNRESFKKYGIVINSVIDYMTSYTDVPERELPGGLRNSGLKGKLKRTPFHNTFLAKWYLAHRNYFSVGRNAARNVDAFNSKHPQSLIVFEDAVAAYHCLKTWPKHSRPKVVYMTHMYGDEMEQYLMGNKVLEGTFVEKRFRRIFEFVYKNADFVVTICQSAKQSLLNRFNINSVVIYNSLEDIDIKKTVRSDNKVRFVVASSINERKGSDLLCEAILNLPPKYDECAEFHIFGDGPYKSTMEEKLRQKDNVFMYGAVNAPYTRYGELDVMILPSRMETLPMSIIEAMRAHMPVMATDVGATKELIDDNVTGYLIQPNVKGIVEGIIKAIDNKDCIDMMGENGYVKFLSQFESNAWVSHFVDLFKDA